MVYTLNNVKMNKIMNITIYMKSGNNITLDKVIDYNFIYTDKNKITRLEVKQKTKGLFKAKNILDIPSIDLSQIEGITVKL